MRRHPICAHRGPRPKVVIIKFASSMALGQSSGILWCTAHRQQSREQKKNSSLQRWPRFSRSLVLSPDVPPHQFGAQRVRLHSGLVRGNFAVGTTGSSNCFSEAGGAACFPSGCPHDAWSCIRNQYTCLPAMRIIPMLRVRFCPPSALVSRLTFVSPR